MKLMQWTILLGLMIVGGWLRLRGLGDLGLWGDEGYQAAAVEAILERGVPRLVSGALYLRGLPFQYLEACSSLVFGFNEFALRFPSVICNLLTIPVIYLLGKELFNKEVGLIAAFVLCFSVWEIEMARFARMYTCLQLFYCLGLWTFYKGYIRGERVWQWITFFVFALTILSHQLGIFLVSCYFIPLFMRGYRIANRFFLVFLGLLLGVLGKLYGKLAHELSYGAIKVAGDDGANSVVNNFSGFLTSLRLDIFEQLLRSPGMSILYFIITAAVTVWLVTMLVRSRTYPKTLFRRRPFLFALGILGLTAIHHFGLAAVVLLVCPMVCRRDKDFFTSSGFRAGVAIFISYLVFWVLYGVLDPGWYQKYALDLEAGTLPLTAKLLSILGHYPRTGERFLSVFLQGWPVMTLVTLGVAVRFYLRSLKMRQRPRDVYVCLIFVLPIFLLGLPAVEYINARYSFAIYSVMIIFFSFFVYALVKRTGLFLMHFGWGHTRPFLRPLSFVILSFVLCADLSFSKAYALGTRSYMSPLDSRKAVVSHTYHFHKDHQSAGRYVQAHKNTEDLIISFQAAIDCHYAGRTDYYYVGKQADTFQKDWYTKDIFTNAVLLKTADDLASVFSANSDKRIWILGYTHREFARELYSSDLLQLIKSLEPFRVYTARDGRTPVYLVTGRIR